MFYFVNDDELTVISDEALRHVWIARPIPGNPLADIKHMIHLDLSD